MDKLTFILFYAQFLYVGNSYSLVMYIEQTRLYGVARICTEY